MDEESKAIPEIAKTTGKAIDAARDFGGFIAKYISGSVEQAFGIVEDKLIYTRWERQVRLMQRADLFLKRVGLSCPTREVPLKVMIPLLQGATLEEDDDLQDRWAILLVNAANAEFPIEIRRAYLNILEQLSPLEVRILDNIYALPFSKMQHDGVATLYLPDSVSFASPLGGSNFPAPDESIQLALGNLARVGCIRLSTTWGGGESFGRILPTILGHAFVSVCRIPEA